MLINETNYLQVLDIFVQRIRTAKRRATVLVNNELLSVYWEIGSMIGHQITQEGWGTKVIERISRDLKGEFPGMKGLSVRNIQYMRTFAEAYPDFAQVPPAQMKDADNQSNKITQALLAQLTWYHHTTLLDKVPNLALRYFYIKKAIENGWSRNMMLRQIETQLHIRSGKSINNFKVALPPAQSDLVREMINNPMIFEFLEVNEQMQERELEKALISHLKKFMLELGRGFSYVGNQYKLTVNGDEYFLDLLFYNFHLHCFVVFELKIGDFQPEFAGKLNFYINTINEQLKTDKDYPTIGVLLCKTPNETVIKFALNNMSAPMGVVEYQFSTALPEQLSIEMPTIEELETEIKKEVQDFQEKQNNVQDRWTSLKQTLKNLFTEEIQIAANYEILSKLYQNWLRPFYQELIDAFAKFSEAFYNTTWGWRALNTQANDLAAIDQVWSDRQKLEGQFSMTFYYNLLAFKKGGVETSNVYFELTLEINTYHYSFQLQGPQGKYTILKKLYHQLPTSQEKEQIIEQSETQIMDELEKLINRINRL